MSEQGRTAVVIQYSHIYKFVYQCRPHQHLIIHIPKELPRFGRMQVVGSRRSIVPISEKLPHGIVEEAVRPSANIAFFPLCQFLCHNCVQRLSADDAGVKRVHIEVTH